jgi:flagellar basal body rod protein FlgB
MVIMSKEQIAIIKAAMGVTLPTADQISVRDEVKKTDIFRKASDRLKIRRDTANKPKDEDVFAEVVAWQEAIDRIKGARYLSGWRSEPGAKDIEAEVIKEQERQEIQRAREQQAAQDIQRVARKHLERKKARESVAQEVNKALEKRLASGETVEVQTQEREAAKQRLQEKKWFSAVRSGPSENEVSAEVTAEKDRLAKVREERFSEVWERRKEDAERGAQKGKEAEARRDDRKKEAKENFEAQALRRAEVMKSRADQKLRAKLESSAIDFAKSMGSALAHEAFLKDTRGALLKIEKEINNTLSAVSTLTTVIIEAENAGIHREKAPVAQMKAMQEKSEKDLHRNKVALESETKKVDEMHNPHTLMTKAIEIATIPRKDGKEFNRDVFRFAMKTMLLGPDFEEFKGDVKEKDKKALGDAEKKLDADLVKLAEAIDHGIKTNTLDKPQENSLIRKCLIGLTRTVASLVMLAMGVIGMGFGVGARADLGMDVNQSAAAGAAVGLAGGFIGYKIVTSLNKFINAKSPSSAIEAQMDALVTSVDKGFSAQMAKIATQYREAPKGEVSEEEKGAAAKTIQDKKWFGGMRSGPTKAEVDTEVAAERDRQAREAKAASVATRFQDRIGRVKEQGKTFVGRVAAAKRADDKGTGK